jgi:hypothetical protein
LQKTDQDELQRPPQPEFALNERVKSSSWGGDSDLGTIIGIKWIYHLRLFEYTWGYKIKWDNKDIWSTFEYVPEGYLRKMPKE